MSLKTSEPREHRYRVHLNKECAVDRAQWRAFGEGRRQLSTAWRLAPAGPGNRAQSRENPGAGKTPEQEAPEPKTPGSAHP